MQIYAATAKFPCACSWIGRAGDGLCAILTTISGRGLPSNSRGRNADPSKETAGTGLEPVPGDYKNMLRLPF
jgi:hypothetical protein